MQIIIIGSPTSGKSAFLDLLNIQNNTFITDELFSYDNDTDFSKRLNSEWFSFFSTQCKKKNVDPELFRDYIIKNNTKIAEYLYSSGYQIVGDKCGAYILPVFHKKFIQMSKKNIKFIFCVRDCRAFISHSLYHYVRGLCLTSQWVHSTIDGACAHWVKYNQGLLKLIQYIPEENYVIFQFEKVVKDNAKVIQKISNLTEGLWTATLKEVEGYCCMHVDAWKIEHPEIDKHLSEDALRLMELYGYEYD